jgi:hypothetical protein
VNLLEKAKSRPAVTTRRGMAHQRETFDLAYAWLTGEINTAQAAHAFGNKNQSSALCTMAAALKNGIAMGWMSIHPDR